MASVKIDEVDKTKGHVTFTVTFDDKTKQTDTRCDLHYKDVVVEDRNDEGSVIGSHIERQPQNVKETLEAYAEELNAAHMADKAVLEAAYADL